jgi:hypothetical protein
VEKKKWKSHANGKKIGGIIAAILNDHYTG